MTVADASKQPEGVVKNNRIDSAKRLLKDS